MTQKRREFASFLRCQRVASPARGGMPPKKRGAGRPRILLGSCCSLGRSPGTRGGGGPTPRRPAQLSTTRHVSQLKLTFIRDRPISPLCGAQSRRRRWRRASAESRTVGAIRIACWSNTPTAQKWRFQRANTWLRDIIHPSTRCQCALPRRLRLRLPKRAIPMPRGLKGEKRPTDVKGRAVMIA